MKSKFVILLSAILFHALSSFGLGNIVVTFSYTSTTANLNSIRAFPGNIANTASCCSAHVKMEIVSTSIPSGWSISICDPNGCHSVGITSTTFTLSPSGNGYVGVDFHIDSTIGTGTVNIRWTNLDDTTNVINMTFTITAGPAGIASIETMNTPLAQNFPNPFLTSTTIKYSIRQPNGKLAITDLQGKMIEEHTLNNASGELLISTENLRPGIYFYSLYAGDKVVATNKMMVQ